MKVAISVPDPIYDAADRLAKQQRIPRSRLVAQALEEYIARHGDEAITQQLNDIYAAESSTMDAALTRAQAASIADEAW